MPIHSPELRAAQDLANVLARAATEIAPGSASLLNMPPSPSASYDHGLAVAGILEDWELQGSLQAAGVLHSFVWNGMVSEQEVAGVCGAEVARLGKMYRDIRQQTTSAHWRGTPHALELIKLFIAAYCDPRLAILGAADLWHHFVLLRQNALSPQHSFAAEARYVLLPLLDMLGMWGLRRQLNDWLLQNGKERNLVQHLQNRLDQTDNLRKQAFEVIQENLSGAQFGRINARPRTPADIFNARFAGKPNPEAIEALGVDVLVTTEQDCYLTLYNIHQLWRPIEGALSDSVGAGKINGYRCLRTAVMLPLGNSKVRVDFHIRTETMDEINRWGVTAGFRRNPVQANLTEAWWSHRDERFQHISSASLGSLPETLYVFSPQGQLFAFQKGCTVVDYAYQVHSEVANQCARFLVNGEVVSPTTPLHHLDLVEIERDTSAPGPTLVWLNAAHTSRAREHIDRFLKRQRKVSFEGRRVLNQRLAALETYYGFAIPEHRIDQAITAASRRLNFPKPEDMLSDIAAGLITPDQILHPLFADEIIRQVQLPDTIRLRPHQIELAQCCRPRLGDDIIGRCRIRKNQLVGLRIHEAKCRCTPSEANQVEIKWRLQPSHKVVTRLEMAAMDEPGLLGDVLKPIYEKTPRVTLHEVNASVHQGTARLSFLLEAETSEMVDLIVQEIRSLQGRRIEELEQLKPLLSELETLGTSSFANKSNPYGRLPVRDREMFVGRSDEMKQIADALTSNAGVVFVRGQKRVGKTSLLLYLKQHYLKRLSTVPVFIDFQLFGRLWSSNLFYEVANALYHDLQAQGRLSDVAAPFKELFDQDPAFQLIAYLTGIKRHFGSRHVVLLMDEFSRVIDACQQGQLDSSIIEQWRGVVQATCSDMGYVIVVQQRTFDILREAGQGPIADGSWRLLELGDTLALKPLKEKDARRLVEWPTRNFIEFTSENLDDILALTGGSPFLIQTFCHNLVNRMTRQDQRRISSDDIEAICVDFMGPNENSFDHLLEECRGLADAVCRHLARLWRDRNSPTSSQALHAALQDIPPAQLQRTLLQLAESNILTCTSPDNWQFASLLFGRWVASNLPVERFPAR